MRIIPMV